MDEHEGNHFSRQNRIFYIPMSAFGSLIQRRAVTHVQIGLSAQSIVHGDVLSEKINFSAHGSSNSAKFGPDYLDP